MERSCPQKSRTLALLLLLLAAAPPAGLARDRVARVVDAVIRPLMARDALPGAAVGVIAHGRSRVFDFGVASLRTHRPVTSDTLFEIGSVSKIFTAVLASYAARTDHLALTDRTRRYLPSLRGSPFGDRVNLLDLGTHTPGGVPLQVPDNIHTRADLMRYLRAWRPRYPPGTYRTYSNLGIGLLGLVAARSLHLSFARALRRSVLDTLGLRHTFLTVPAAEMPHYAQGYTSAGRPIRMSPGYLWQEAYGIRTTAGDLTRFLAANLGLIRLDATLQRAIIATHTGYFKAGALTQDLIWEQYRYPVPLQTLLEGNSLRMLFEAVPASALVPPEKPRADTWIDKTGATNGFAAYVAFVPEKGLGVVILANRDYPIADQVTAAYDILTALARGPQAGAQGESRPGHGVSVAASGRDPPARATRTP